MRGHIGFKIRHGQINRFFLTQAVTDILVVPPPELKITSAYADALVLPPTELKVTSLYNDALVVPPSELKITSLYSDALVFAPPELKIHITSLYANALILPPPEFSERITSLYSDIFVLPPLETKIQITSCRADVWAIVQGVPAKPQDVVVSGINNGAYISFSPVLNNGAVITSYSVQYSTNGTTWTTATFAAENFDIGYLTVTGLTNNIEYVFRVAATNEFGTGPYSDITEPITPNAATSILPITLDVDELIYNGLTVANTRTVSFYRGHNYFTYTLSLSSAYYTGLPFLFTLRVSVINGAENGTGCASSVYAETGEHVGGCIYSYQFQCHEDGDPPNIWTNLFTAEYTVYDQILYSTPTLILPTNPYLYTAVSNDFLNDHFHPFYANKSYHFRCIVTRKSDNAAVIVYNPYLKISFLP